MDDSLLVDLEKHANGANAHTANKARMYLRIFAEKKAGGLETLEKMCRTALQTNDWERLRKYLSPLW